MKLSRRKFMEVLAATGLVAASPLAASPAQSRPALSPSPTEAVEGAVATTSYSLSYSISPSHEWDPDMDTEDD